jgi:uncharacterized protein YbgA (DUF1722 family)/uncharacterized protein YbbK (DUF523 family)
MADFAKPVVYISRCITFEAVRYNGERISSVFVDALKPFIIPITHCPEVEIGLPVPRHTLRIVSDDREMKKLRLVQPDTGDDLTVRMNKWVRETLDNLPEVDGFILKSKSPSSGAFDVKIYPSIGDKPAALTKRGSGFFGGEVLRRFPDKIVEDDGRLNDGNIADHFLKRIFLSAAFREVKKSAKISGLTGFHERNKLLFMSYNQKIMHTMGNICANRENKPFDEVVKEYEKYMLLCVGEIYKTSNIVNSFEHAFGYFKDKLASKEKKYFIDILDKYRTGRAHISLPITLIKSYIIRFDEKYLDGQTFFKPYPELMMERKL